MLSPESMAGFCCLCEQICGESAASVKTELVNGFLQVYKGDFVLLFRLLLPRLSGRKYHLQDKQIATLLARLCGRAEQEVRAEGAKLGDVSALAAALPVAKKATSSLSLQKVDGYLDRLSQGVTEDKQHAVLKDFSEEATSEDLKWFIRLVKQDLRLNAGVKCILHGLHKDAYDAYKAASSIALVVKKFSGEAAGDEDPFEQDDYVSPDEEGGSPSPPSSPKKKGGGSLVQLNTPVRPQLARPAAGIEDVISRCPNSFFSETKYDGERIQIHKSSDGSFTFWARSCRPMKEDKYEGLEKHLVTSFKSMRTCIWDGEILLIDRTTGCPLPFGTLGRHKKTQFKDANTCIFLFDLLEVDGEELLDEPILTRRKVMNDKLAVIPNRVMLSEMRHIKGTREVMEQELRKHLQHAVALSLEGLVLKDVRSKYAPGKRAWIKLKRDYLKGMADSADLVVLGGNWGSGSNSGIVSTFLMGCFDRLTKTWKTVCKVGNGHDDATLKKINEEMKHILKPSDKKKLPAWLDCHSHNITDFFVTDPYKSVVWEIVGAEFTKSLTHTANGVSLRFPRVVKIRDDKKVTEATTLQQLASIVEASKKRFGVNMLPPLEEEGEDASPEPPAAASPAPAPQVPPPPPASLPANVEYTEGDVVRLVNTTHSFTRVIAHCVASQGRWSDRGTMGQITRVLGDEPKDKYDEVAATLVPGDVQIQRVSDPYTASDSLYVASMVAQEKPKKGCIPLFSMEGFRTSWNKVVAWAASRKGKASVHLAKVTDDRIPWEEVNDAILKATSNTGVHVTVYTKTADEADKYNAVVEAQLKAASRQAPPPAGDSLKKKRKQEEAEARNEDKKKKKAAVKLDSDAKEVLLGESTVCMQNAPPLGKSHSELMSLETESIVAPKKPVALEVRGSTLSPGRTVTASTGGATTIMYDKPCEVLERRTVLISGYPAADKQVIRTRLVSLGATVVSSFAACTPDTILVCQTMTEDYEKAVARHQVVVTRDWVDKCLEVCGFVDPARHAWPPAAEVKADAGLPVAIFSDCIIYLFAEDGDGDPAEGASESNAALLERYILAHDGDTTDTLSPLPTHIIVLAVGNRFRQLIASRPKLLNISVTPQWLWASIQAQCKLDISAFSVSL